MEIQQNILYCSIISKQDIAFARVLAITLKENSPESKFIALLADSVDNYFIPSQEPFDVITLDQMTIPNLTHLCFQYNKEQLRSTLKHYLNDYLSKAYSEHKVIYVDQDVKNGVKDYHVLLHQHEYENCKSWPYAFEKFENNLPVLDIHRDIYRRLGNVVEIFGNPFFTQSENSFYNWFRKQELLSNANPGAPLPYGINLLGHFHSEKGLGSGVRSLLSSIKAAHIPHIQIDCRDDKAANVDQSVNIFSSDNNFLINLVHLNADNYVHYSEKRAQGFFQGHYNIGFWNWELSKFPEELKHSADYFNEIWVPSKHTQHSVMSATSVPVRCIPYSITVPKNLPEGINRSYFELPEDKLIYLFAFDFSSILERKNPQAVIKAFLKAFNNQEDVLLLLKTVHGEIYPREMQKLQDLCKGYPNIRFYNKTLSREEMYALTKVCDVFVSLHRCEGFGFHLYEAMAMEKPVIATAYSSNIDYMNDLNSFPVKYELVKIEKDYPPYQKGEVWAEPDIDYAAEQMRMIYEYPDIAQKKAAQAALDIQKYLSPDNVGSIIKRTLNQMILNGLPPYPKFPDSEDSNRTFGNISHIHIESHRPFIGPFIVLIKKLFQIILRPSLEKQTNFNYAIWDELKQLSHRLDVSDMKVKELQATVTKLNDRNGIGHMHT